MRTLSSPIDTTTVRFARAAFLPFAAAFAVLSGCTAQPAPEPAPTPISSSVTTETPKGCGTVAAASGLTLEVLGAEESGVPCEQARPVVERFHRLIAGKQSANSAEPVSETFDGWLCVSGPPAAQGGTTCGKAEQTVLAAVVPPE